MGTIRDFKYKKIENFLDPDVVRLACSYCEIRHRHDYKIVSSQGPTEGNYDTEYYADPFGESLMISSIEKMNNLTGLQLLPTYSFLRVYTFDSQLKEHRDRPSCEISVTVNLGNSGEDWPIYMEDKPVILKPGDALIYLGCELKHKREKFTGDFNAQIFMHYVDKFGPNANFVLDKRTLPGEQQ